MLIQEVQLEVDSEQVAQGEVQMLQVLSFSDRKYPYSQLEHMPWREQESQLDGQELIQEPDWQESKPR